MSLRNTIAAIVQELETHQYGKGDPTQEIINKVLDAAVKSVRDECNSTDLNDLAGFEIEDMVVEAIQRLKEAK